MLKRSNVFVCTKPLQTLSEKECYWLLCKIYKLQTDMVVLLKVKFSFRFLQFKSHAVSIWTTTFTIQSYWHFSHSYCTKQIRQCDMLLLPSFVLWTMFWIVQLLITFNVHNMILLKFVHVSSNILALPFYFIMNIVTATIMLDIYKCLFF